MVRRFHGALPAFGRVGYGILSLSTSAKRVAKSKKRSPSITPSKVKATAKKAAKEAAVAAGLAAIGTVLEELSPGEKKRGGRATEADDEETR